ncbi:VOC family protein [Kineococcus sp. NBC_00420]|uniref:VOC family protein n=1 Tax=Kineococcus sp. NBC_00420 TaxID=2903564 RepID=UPI002E241D2D
MRIDHVLAVAPVTDLAAATDWYTRLFGRVPDNRPMETLVEWRLTDTGWLQVFRTGGSPGTTTVNLAVADLDEALSELRGRGLQPGEVLEASKGVRLSALRDPAGNTVTLISGFRVEY